MGMGYGTGAEKAVEAAKLAIESPLLETNIDGATGVLINIMGGEQLTLFEIEKIAEIVRQEAHPDANIIFGACIDPNLDDEIKVTVIATGFNSAKTSNPIKASSDTEPRPGGYTWPSFLEDANE